MWLCRVAFQKQFGLSDKMQSSTDAKTQSYRIKTQSAAGVFAGRRNGTGQTRLERRQIKDQFQMLRPYGSGSDHFLSTSCPAPESRCSCERPSPTVPARAVADAVFHLHQGCDSGGGSASGPLVFAGVLDANGAGAQRLRGASERLRVLQLDVADGGQIEAARRYDSTQVADAGEPDVPAVSGRPVPRGPRHVSRSAAAPPGAAVHPRTDGVAAAVPAPAPCLTPSPRSS